jgi:uncharacterized protein YqfB (UPF0267 family)
LEFHEDLSEEVMKLEEKAYFDEELKRREQIKLSILPEQKAKQEKLKLKNQPKVITDEQILDSSFFIELVKRFNFVKRARKDSLQSNVTKVLTFISSICSGEKIPLEEVDQKWWRDNLINHRNTLYGEKLFQLNESGKLMLLVKQYGTKKHETKFSTKTPNFYYHERITHCWRCHTTLMSKTHSKFSSCNWLICSCGSCRQGCSS